MVKVLMQPSGEKVDLVVKILKVIMVQIMVVEEVLRTKLEHDQAVVEHYVGRIAFQ